MSDDASRKITTKLDFEVNLQKLKSYEQQVKEIVKSLNLKGVSKDAIPDIKEQLRHVTSLNRKLAEQKKIITQDKTKLKGLQSEKKTKLSINGKPVSDVDLAKFPKEIQDQLRQKVEDQYTPQIESLKQKIYRQVSEAGITNKELRKAQKSLNDKLVNAQEIEQKKLAKIAKEEQKRIDKETKEKIKAKVSQQKALEKKAKEQLRLIEKQNKEKLKAENKAKISEQRAKKERERTINKIKKTAKRFAIAASAFATGTFVFTKFTAQYAYNLDQVSKSTGLAVSLIHELELAGQKAGLKVDEVTKSLKRFAFYLGGSKNLRIKLYKLIEKLGIQYKDENGNIKQSGILYAEVAKKIMSLKDESERLFFAQRILGAENINLVEFMAQSSEAFTNQRAEVRKLAYILDNEAVEASKKFIKTWTELKMVITGFKNKVSIALMPIMSQLITRFNNWYMENKRVIDSNIDKFAESLANSFEKVANSVAKATEKIKKLSDELGGLDDLAVLLLSGGFLFTKPGKALVKTVGKSAIGTGAGMYGAGKFAASTLKSEGIKQGAKTIAKTGGVKAAGALAGVGLPLIKKGGWVALAGAIGLAIVDVAQYLRGEPSYTGEFLGKKEQKPKPPKNLLLDLQQLNIQKAYEKHNDTISNFQPYQLSSPYIRGTGDTTINNNIREDVTINVPAGTTEEQTRVIKDTVSRAMQTQFNSFFEGELINTYNSLGTR